MAKYKFSLSAKPNEADERQILVRATIDRNTRLRFKSGVWINPVYFDDSANEILIPKKGRLNYMEVKAATTAKNQLEAFINRVDKICAAMTSHMEDLTVDFVESALIATSNISTDDITYYSIISELNTRKEQEKAQERIKERGAASFLSLMRLYRERKNFKYDTYKNYRALERALARYERFVRFVDDSRKDFTLDIDTLTSNDIEDLADYLRNEKELSEEYPELFERILQEYPEEIEVSRRSPRLEGRGENSVRIMLRKVKTFFVWCNKMGYTDNHPFDKISIGVEHYGTPFYLTIEERNKIAETDLQAAWDNTDEEKKRELKELATLTISNIMIQRDIFIFQCLIGCRVGDLLKLTQDNIINNAVEYIPHKTIGKQPKAVRVPLNKRALALVEKYDGVDKKGRLMPFISAQKYNQAIKAALVLCGIDRQVTILNSLTGKEEKQPIWKVASSHMARRTFIGNLYKKVQDPNLIGSMSGHAEGSKAFVRYRDIDEDMKKNVVSLID